MLNGFLRLAFRVCVMLGAAALCSYFILRMQG